MKMAPRPHLGGAGPRPVGQSRGVAIDDEIANFRSREIVCKAAQEGKALQTKIVLKYTGITMEVSCEDYCV